MEIDSLCSKKISAVDGPETDVNTEDITIYFTYFFQKVTEIIKYVMPIF